MADEAAGDTRPDRFRISDELRLEVDILGSPGSNPRTEPATGTRDEAADDGLSLLIADDDPDIRMYVQRCLRSWHRRVDRVFEARDGGEAIELLLREEVDLIVTDAVMPIVDGFALCREVRSRPALREIPILLMTGEMTSAEAARRPAEAGATAVLAKPFNARRLCDGLEKLLRSSPPPTARGGASEEE